MMGYNSTFVVNNVMVTTPEAPVVDPTDPPVNQPMILWMILRTALPTIVGRIPLTLLPILRNLKDITSR